MECSAEAITSALQAATWCCGHMQGFRKWCLATQNQQPSAILRHHPRMLNLGGCKPRWDMSLERAEHDTRCSSHRVLPARSPPSAKTGLGRCLEQGQQNCAAHALGHKHLLGSASSLPPHPAGPRVLWAPVVCCKATLNCRTQPPPPLVNTPAAAPQYRAGRTACSGHDLHRTGIFQGTHPGPGPQHSPRAARMPASSGRRKGLMRSSSPRREGMVGMPCSQGAPSESQHMRHYPAGPARQARHGKSRWEQVRAEPARRSSEGRSQNYSVYTWHKERAGLSHEQNLQQNSGDCSNNDSSYSQVAVLY